MAGAPQGVGGSIVLAGCVSQKRDRACAARDLYTSPLFRYRRVYAEGHGGAWFVLSALHGLVAPDQVLEPYDLRLGSLPKRERSRWGAQVAAQLRHRLGELRGLVFEVHAGAAYADAVEPPLVELGAEVVRPLHGLSIGRQLQWYRQHGRSIGA